MYCATFHGLDKWFVHVFEKAGWMFLARAIAMDPKCTAEERSEAQHKIKAYSNEMKHLIKALSKAEYSDPDKMKDIKHMHEKVGILVAHLTEDYKGIVENFAMGGGAMKKKSSKKTLKK